VRVTEKEAVLVELGRGRVVRSLRVREPAGGEVPDRHRDVEGLVWLDGGEVGGVDELGVGPLSARAKGKPRQIRLTTEGKEIRGEERRGEEREPAHILSDDMIIPIGIGLQDPCFFIVPLVSSRSGRVAQ
jgi:hypothetical protein